MSESRRIPDRQSWIKKFLKENPGATARQMARAAHVVPTSMRFTLRALVKKGEVDFVLIPGDGPPTKSFYVGKAPRDMAEGHTWLSQIRRFMAKHGQATVRELQDELGVPKSSARYAVDNLLGQGEWIDSGKVQRTKTNRVYTSRIYIQNPNYSTNTQSREDSMTITNTPDFIKQLSTIMDKARAFEAACESRTHAAKVKAKKAARDLKQTEEVAAQRLTRIDSLEAQVEHFKAALKEAEQDGRRWREAYHAENLRREDAERALEETSEALEGRRAAHLETTRELEALKAKQAQLGQLLSGFINP